MVAVRAVSASGIGEGSAPLCYCVGAGEVVSQMSQSGAPREFSNVQRHGKL